MANFNLSLKTDFTINMSLSEKEARALDAMVSYGFDNFIKNFYQHLGKYYLEPHENGLKTFFNSVQNDLPNVLDKIDRCKKELNS